MHTSPGGKSSADFDLPDAGMFSTYWPEDCYITSLRIPDQFQVMAGDKVVVKFMVVLAKRQNNASDRCYDARACGGGRNLKDRGSTDG